MDFLCCTQGLVTIYCWNLTCLTNQIPEKMIKAAEQVVAAIAVADVVVVAGGGDEAETKRDEKN